MAKLIYTAITSLDGYVADEKDNFDWAAPDEEVHSFINGLERSIGTYLLGRRMYETMRYWETARAATGHPRFAVDYAEIWRAADKVVYSKTLEFVSSEKTRIERTFDSEAVRYVKATAVCDIGIGGPQLAASAIEAGLVEEFRLFVAPIVVGGGKPWLPNDVCVKLELLQERRFPCGSIYLRYRTLP